MLDGKVAFITGSTRGIGWATAKRFADEGASVIVNGHSDQRLLDQRVEELRATCQAEAWGVLCDVGNPAQIRDAYQQIFQQHKRLDVLVNNAGVLQDALLGMIAEEVVQQTFAVNALGAIYSLQAAARLMSRAASGSIVNVTSIIGVTGNEGQAVYGASKAAIIGLTRSAAKELAPKNIRVNAVAPGFIETDMTAQLPQQKFAERTASIRMGRIGKPDDVADVILFLASDLSRYVTGQVIGVDGGMLI
jgi:3-oxoacyl-[acyl-carrier protein] reductase